MCLILFAYDCHPRYQLVVAANRDEFYRRPALPAGFWADKPHILAGKDLREGGTWMGITTSGRFAALTNYRDPSCYNQQAPSRGHLVHNYLNSSYSPEEYLHKLNDEGTAYNGYNLLLGTYDSMYYYSNREGVIRKLKKGVYGLSNSLLNVPWPKVRQGISRLTEVVQNKDIDAEHLFSIMADQEQPDDKDLPDTGVGLTMERMLAPAFVTSENYGTRVTTVILADRNHNVRFWERSFTDIDRSNEVYHEFTGIWGSVLDADLI